MMCESARERLPYAPYTNNQSTSCRCRALILEAFFLFNIMVNTLRIW